jgi:hypothetical protein
MLTAVSVALLGPGAAALEGGPVVEMSGMSSIARGWGSIPAGGC